MDKPLFFFIIFAFIAGSFLINSLEKLDENDKTLIPSKIEKNKYIIRNSLGYDILMIDNLSEKKQNEIWNNSPIKNEIINSFPNFEIMKEKVDIKIGGNIFKIKLLNKINEIDIKYTSGDIDREQAIKSLNLK